MAKGMSEGVGPNVAPPPGTRIECGNPDTDGRVRMLIGKSIRLRREKAGLTQAAAAELFGVSRETVMRWEKGQGSLWTGGPGRTIDHSLMETLRVTYGVLSMAEMIGKGALRNQYPSAPLDPVERRLFFWRRNALMQGYDPDEAVAMHSASHAERMEARQRGG